jgi:aryl-alcohol dehydrogenase-like predicted oxidoreductase
VSDGVQTKTHEVPSAGTAGTVKDLIQQTMGKHFGLEELSVEAIRRANYVRSVPQFSARRRAARADWRERGSLQA